MAPCLSGFAGDDSADRKIGNESQWAFRYTGPFGLLAPAVFHSGGY
jgi:hypothetical protein